MALFGGATVACEERIGRMCTLPQPMNDVYFIDVRPLPSTTAVDPDTVRPAHSLKPETRNDFSHTLNRKPRSGKA